VSRLTIWKWPLLGNPEIATDHPTIDMPYGANVLCIQTQNGVPCVWAEVDSTEPTEIRRFVIVGTGQPIPDDADRYVGTWQSGPFVFHLFEAKRG
jgi:hypothetical protein